MTPVQGSFKASVLLDESLSYQSRRYQPFRPVLNTHSRCASSLRARGSCQSRPRHKSQIIRKVGTEDEQEPQENADREVIPSISE